MNDIIERDVTPMTNKRDDQLSEQDTLAKDFGKRLEKLRKMRGWTQVEAAKRLKKSQSAYSAWEKGDNVPRFRELPLIKELMQTTYQYLYGEADDPREKSEEEVVKKYEEKRIRDVLGISESEADILGEERMKALYSFYRFQLAESLEKRNQNVSNKEEDEQ